MKTTCSGIQGCATTWTGTRIEHCPECHETFTGQTAGDKHRVGDHAVSTGPERRRCMSADEMRGKKMVQNERGQWGMGGTMPPDLLAKFKK